jgi:hypothetical protein
VNTPRAYCARCNMSLRLVANVWVHRLDSIYVEPHKPEPKVAR